MMNARLTTLDRAELVTNYKLKLKNEKPDFIESLLNRQIAKSFTRMATNFGTKPSPPALVEALADLHSETIYATTGEFTRFSDKWEAAKAYAALKKMTQDFYPENPLPNRSSSLTSLESQASVKSVRWAEIEAEVKVFDGNAPPKSLSDTDEAENCLDDTTD